MQVDLPLHYTNGGMMVPVLADLKLPMNAPWSMPFGEVPFPSSNMEGEEDEIIQEGAMDLATPIPPAPVDEKFLGRRGRRPSLSAHTSPSRRPHAQGLSMEFPTHIHAHVVEPRSAVLSPSAGRFRSGSSASGRAGYYRSGSSISVSTTGSSSVSSFGFGNTSGCLSAASYSEMPSLPMTPLAAVDFDELNMMSQPSVDAEMEPSDTGMLEQEMQASRIHVIEESFPPSASVSSGRASPELPPSHHSSTYHGPRSASACSHLTVASAGSTLTPDRVNRKRRNSRLHASLHTPLQGPLKESGSFGNEWTGRDGGSEVKQNKRLHYDENVPSSNVPASCQVGSINGGGGIQTPVSAALSAMMMTDVESIAPLLPSPISDGMISESGVSVETIPVAVPSQPSIVDVSEIQRMLVEAEKIVVPTAITLEAPATVHHHKHQEVQNKQPVTHHVPAPVVGGLVQLPAAPVALHGGQRSSQSHSHNHHVPHGHHHHHSHRLQQHLPFSPTRQPLISVLSCVLEQLFSNPQDTLPTDPKQISMFHTERIPSISIGQYLDRISFYSECSEEALVMAFIHISRIYHSNTGAANGNNAQGQKVFQLNTLSIHRLLLVAVMSASKFWDDSYFNNAFFGKIGGVATKELNALEVEFLALIAFELYIPSKIYKRFYTELMNPALHPCKCSFKLLPPLTHISDNLPPSPNFDAPIEELSNGVDLLVFPSLSSPSLNHHSNHYLQAPREDSESSLHGRSNKHTTVRRSPINLPPISNQEKPSHHQNHPPIPSVSVRHHTRSVHLDECEVKLN